MKPVKITPEFIAAVHAIVLAHIAAKRHALKPQIELIQKTLSDKTDLFSDRRGQHWKTKTVRVDIRGSGTYHMTYEEVCAATHYTKKQLQTMMSKNEGKACFMVDDEIYTVSRETK